MSISRPMDLSRRRLLSIGTLSAGGLALTGCVSANSGQGADTKPSAGALKSTGTPAGEITIVDDNTNLVFKKSTIAAFEKATGVKVKSYSQGNFNDLHDRYATLFAAQDSSVDVVMTWAGWSAEFGQAGWLEELDASVVPDDLIKPALDSVSWQDKLYGLPKFSSVQTMFWNKTMYADAGIDPETGPEDWNAFLKAAKSVTRDDQFGYACDIGNPAGAYQNFLRMLLLNGGTMYDADYRPVFNSEHGVQALSYFVDLLHKHKVMDPASLQITNASDLSDLFAKGATGMVFNWPSQWATATAKTSRLDPKTVGNGLIPGISVRSASIDGSEGFAINKYSKNKQAALAWLQFVATGEVQRKIVADEGWFPVTDDVLTDQASIEALPVLTTYQQTTKYVTKRFGVPWSNELDQLMSVQVSNAMNRKTTPKQALDDAVKQTQKLVTKYLKK